MTSVLPDAITKSSIPILVATLFNFVVVLICLLLIGGRHVYPLDDTYIHLSIARSIADYGVWGISRFDYAAASSSPFYTLLLVFLYKIGPKAYFEYFPLAVNVLCIPLFAAITYQALIAQKICSKRDPGKHLVAVVAVSIVTPLVVVAIGGMEHALQVTCFLAYVFLVSRAVFERTLSPRSVAVLALMSAVVTTVRYEGVVLVGMAGVFLLVSRKVKVAFLVGIAGLVPLVLFGALWAAHGGWAVPNSILIKGTMSAVGPVPQGRSAGLVVMVLTVMLAGMLGLSVFSKELKLKDWRVCFAVISIVYSLVLLSVGAVGWLYRYEAAAITLEIVALYILVASNSARWPIFFFFAVVAGLMIRSSIAFYMTIAAPLDRQWEHFAPANFVAEYYPNRTIVVNDIGVMAWINSNARVLDLVGLGDNAMTALRLKGLTPEGVSKWAKNSGASIAIVQLCWPQVSRYIPDEWTLVSVWRGPRNVVFRDKYVGFFAVEREEVAPLERDLRKFGPSGPLVAFSTSDPKSPFYRMSANDIRMIDCNNHDLETWAAARPRDRY